MVEDVHEDRSKIEIEEVAKDYFQNYQSERKGSSLKEEVSTFSLRKQINKYRKKHIYLCIFNFGFLDYY